MIKIIIGTVVVVTAAFIHEFGKYAEEINPYNKEAESDQDY